MVVLGERNSRMKDYFNVWLLSQRFEFRGQSMAEATRNFIDFSEKG